MSDTQVCDMPEVQAQPQPEVKGGVVPYLMVSDAAAAADYYKQAFGAEEVARVAAPDGRLMHVHLYINDGSVMLSDPFPEHGCALTPHQGYTLTLQIDDADRWWARATAAGAEVVMPLQNMFWGARYGQIRDPFGVLWAFNQQLG